MAYYVATRGAPHHRVPPFGRALHYLLTARASGEGHVLLPANALGCMSAQALASPRFFPPVHWRGVRLIVSSDLPEVPLALGRECGLGRVDLFRALCVHSRTGEGASTRILPANLPTNERTFPSLLSAKG